MLPKLKNKTCVISAGHLLFKLINILVLSWSISKLANFNLSDKPSINHFMDTCFEFKVKFKL